MRRRYCDGRYRCSGFPANKMSSSRWKPSGAGSYIFIGHSSVVLVFLAIIGRSKSSIKINDDVVGCRTVASVIWDYEGCLLFLSKTHENKNYRNLCLPWKIKIIEIFYCINHQLGIVYGELTSRLYSVCLMIKRVKIVTCTMSTALFGSIEISNNTECSPPLLLF